MFNFFKSKKKKEDRKKEDIEILGTGFSIINSVENSKQELKQIYSKPETYTGNRKLFDSDFVKKDIKLKAFSEKTIVVDPYTGKELTLTIKEAKLKYGNNWAEYLAEADHKTPLKKIVEAHKNDSFIKTVDIKEIANSENNMEVISRKLNNAKRDRTNEELMLDEGYLQEKGLNFSEEIKEKYIASGKKSEKLINSALKKRSLRNMFSSGHKAGMDGAKNAGMTTLVISGTQNLIQCIKGEKDSKAALKDFTRNTGEAAALGYITSGSLTVVSHSLSSSSSKFLRALANSNVPGKVITAVVLTGDTLRRYTNGEITTEECVLELGEKGLNVVTTGYSMAVGQAIIPIPIVGAAIGAIVGSTITSKYYTELITTLKEKKLEHQERQRIIKESQLIAQEAKMYREELERYLEIYFKDYRDCFDDALNQIKLSFQSGNADGIIQGANKITNKLGGKVYYNSVEEFKEFLESNEVDRL